MSSYRENVLTNGNRGYYDHHLFILFAMMMRGGGDILNELDFFSLMLEVPTKRSEKIKYIRRLIKKALKAKDPLTKKHYTVSCICQTIASITKYSRRQIENYYYKK